MATQERDPRAYELMSVFIPDLSDEDCQAEIEKIEALITGGGGTIKETLTTSPWGRRRLAYTIRFNGVDYRDGIYTVFHFDLAPSALAEIEREMKLDTNLMRYLLVHDDPKAGEKFRDEDEDEAGEDATEAESEQASTEPAAEATAPEAASDAPAEATEDTASEAPAADAQSEAAEEAAAEAAPEAETAPEAPETPDTGETTEKE